MERMDADRQIGQEHVCDHPGVKNLETLKGDTPDYSRWEKRRFQNSPHVELLLANLEIYVAIRFGNIGRESLCFQVPIVFLFCM